jgi:hypothetical protein
MPQQRKSCRWMPPNDNGRSVNQIMHGGTVAINSSEQKCYPTRIITSYGKVYKHYCKIHTVIPTEIHNNIRAVTSYVVGRVSWQEATAIIVLRAHFGRVWFYPRIAIHSLRRSHSYRDSQQYELRPVIVLRKTTFVFKTSCMYRYWQSTYQVLVPIRGGSLGC